MAVSIEANAPTLVTDQSLLDCPTCPAVNEPLNSLPGFFSRLETVQHSNNGNGHGSVLEETVIYQANIPDQDGNNGSKRDCRTCLVGMQADEATKKVETTLDARRRGETVLTPPQRERMLKLE